MTITVILRRIVAVFTRIGAGDKHPEWSLDELAEMKRDLAAMREVRPGRRQQL